MDFEKSVKKRVRGQKSEVLLRSDQVEEGKGQYMRLCNKYETLDKQ